MKAYRAGDCAICGFTGPVYFAKVPVSGALFFVCVLCGVGSTHPPKPNFVESIDDFRVHAPTGFLLPTLEDIVRADMKQLIVEEKELSESDAKEVFRGWLVTG